MSSMDQRSFGLLLISLCCAVLPLDISHLLSGIIGAVLYFVVQALQKASVPAEPSRTHEGKAGKFTKVRSTTPLQCQPRPKLAPKPTTGAGHSLTDASATETEVLKPSVVPVLAPTFQAVGWEAEVQELVERLSPTPESNELVAKMAATVKLAISKIVPDAEVSGYASGNILGGKAFGVAVPEVDIVISASPEALVSRLVGRPGSGGRGSEKLDERQLHKSAIRACTDQLVSMGSFKFRRSAFRGDEPRVTIIAPANLYGYDQGIPMNLSVNAVIPMYNAALLIECGHMEPRAKELILLVRRWAKDRGLCHTAKGHLSPFAWTLLTIYYLQVAAFQDGSPLLPPLSSFRVSAGLMTNDPKGRPQAQPRPNASRIPHRSVASLLQGFMHFYASDFNWRDEAVSVRFGHRAPPDISLPIHVVHEGSTTEAAPSVENPFDTSQNLGGCTTVASLYHLRQELLRADELCARGSSLTELLHPWAPTQTGRAAPSDQTGWTVDDDE